MKRDREDQVDLVGPGTFLHINGPGRFTQFYAVRRAISVFYCLMDGLNSSPFVKNPETYNPVEGCTCLR